jgi:hypothetical protein
MKRIVSLLAITVVALSVVACGGNPPPSKQGDTNNRIEIPLFK